MSFFFNVGSTIGKSAAFVVEGSGIAATQLAQGARTGYDLKAKELRAKREGIAVAAPKQVTRVATKRTARA